MAALKESNELAPLPLDAAGKQPMNCGPSAQAPAAAGMPSRAVSGRLLFLDQFGYLGGGQRVLLETMNSLDPSRFRMMAALAGGGDFKNKLVTEGIHVLHLPLGNYRSWKKSGLDKLRFLFRSIWCALLLARWVRVHRLDLLFANGPRTFACAALAGRVTGRPVIWHLHNVLPAGVELRLLAFLSPWVHTILACSQAAARPLLEKRPSLGSKVKVLHNPPPNLRPAEPAEVLKLRASFGLEAGTVCAGIVGRVTPFKGQLRFLEAARLVLRQEPKVRFFVIGSPADNKADQHYHRRLHALVQEASMSGAVFFLSHRQEIERYMQMLDVVVVASQAPEALPQVVLEAMFLGKAVVAPASGGIVELLEDGETGRLVRAAEPGNLATAMLELIRNPQIREALGRRARERTVHYISREQYAEEIGQTVTFCLASSLKPHATFDPRKN